MLAKNNLYKNLIIVFYKSYNCKHLNVKPIYYTFAFNIRIERKIPVIGIFDNIYKY